MSFISKLLPKKSSSSLGNKKTRVQKSDSEIDGIDAIKNELSPYNKVPIKKNTEEQHSVDSNIHKKSETKNQLREQKENKSNPKKSDVKRVLKLSSLAVNSNPQSSIAFLQHRGVQFSEEALLKVSHNYRGKIKAQQFTLIELGVSPSSFPLENLNEQILHAGYKTIERGLDPSLVYKNSQFGCWIKSDLLRKDAQTLLSLLEKPKVDQNIGISVSKSITLLNQIEFFTSRLSVSKQHSAEEIEFLEALATIFKRGFLNNHQDFCSEKLKKTGYKNSTNDHEDSYALGIALSRLGYITEISLLLKEKLKLGIEFFINSKEHPLTPQLVQTLKIIKYIENPSLKLHQIYSTGKNKFEQKIAHLTNQIEKKDSDPNVLIESFFELDHCSFESFKKIYSILFRESFKELCEDFLNQYLVQITNCPLLKNSLPSFFIAIGDFNRAESLLESSPKKFTQTLDSQYFYSMAFFYFRNRNFKQSIIWLEFMLKKQNNFESIYNLLAVSYSKLEKHKKSIKIYCEGIEQHPRSKKLHHNLAIAFMKNGDKKEAQRHLSIVNQIEIENRAQDKQCL